MALRRRRNGTTAIVTISLLLLALVIGVRLTHQPSTTQAQMTSTQVDLALADSIPIDAMVPTAKRLIDAGDHNDAESDEALAALREQTTVACDNVKLGGTSCEHVLASRALDAARAKYFAGSKH